MILALAGGVGGAKLARGLAAVLPPGESTVIVNTGDDFELFGLTISPDVDSVMYTMAGINDLAGRLWMPSARWAATHGSTWATGVSRHMSYARKCCAMRHCLQ